jgi:hypothetical protein
MNSDVNETLARIKACILAMARVEYVVETFRKSFENTCPNPRAMIHEQDAFARLIVEVESCWSEFGQPERYIKRLVSCFVNDVEKDDKTVESDALMELVFRTSLYKESMPNCNEFCYLSFDLPTISERSMISKDTPRRDSPPPLLRVRVYPYHNDVALRLWEAGSSLAEFFLKHPDILSGKHVLELGAGVGLTGLVITAFCQPVSVFLTDYTEACRLNLEHNLEINRKWLKTNGITPERISQVRIHCFLDLSCKNIGTVSKSTQQILTRLF